MRVKLAMSVAALAAASALVLTGCVNNSETAAPAASSSSTAPTSADSGVNDDAIAMLPAKVKDSGKLSIGVAPNYPPNEAKDDSGNPVGWTIDVGDALAARLGLVAEWKVTQFENIIPSITGGTMNLGMSSFTDNLEREKQVDFVNYYNAGILWASQAGESVDPEDACGLTVTVQATTYEETDELPAKSEACIAAGKPAIDILKFSSQIEVTNALVLGRADAMTADSPITGAAIAATDGKLQAAGKAFEVAPYGIAVSKDSDGLDKAVQAALQSMVDDGSYVEILETWGVADGALTEITINAASKG